MHHIETKAYAKINLYLDIIGRQSNGFHDIESIMQTISLADELVIDVDKAEEGEIKVFCDSLYAPSGSDNIVYSAADVYLKSAGINAKVDISLMKNIPSPAGMGGGSADAAAVLRGLNEIFGAFSIEELESLAAQIGSDVSFCVRGGTQIAKGRGELLSPCKDMPDCYVVVACGGEGLSTPIAYKMLDEKFDYFNVIEESDKLCEFDERMGDLNKICLGLYNIFECVTSECCCEMPMLKQMLIDKEAIGALMCGSGPSVFGIFDDVDKAEKAVNFIQNKGYFAALCTPVKKLI